MLELRRSGIAANTSLFRTWSRPIQVLHGRTHPTMRMHDESGWVFTGTWAGPAAAAAVKAELAEKAASKKRKR